MKINSINSNNIQNSIISFKKKPEASNPPRLKESFSYNPKMLAVALTLATMSPSCSKKNTMDELLSTVTTIENAPIKNMLMQLGENFGIKKLNYEKINDHRFSLHFDMDKTKADCFLKISDSRDSFSGFIMLSEKDVLRPAKDQYRYEAKVGSNDNSIELTYQKLGEEKIQKCKINADKHGNITIEDSDGQNISINQETLGSLSENRKTVLALALLAFLASSIVSHVVFMKQFCKSDTSPNIT